MPKMNFKPQGLALFPYNTLRFCIVLQLTQQAHDHKAFQQRPDPSLLQNFS
jgi:hypothetical protein